MRGSILALAAGLFMSSARAAIVALNPGGPGVVFKTGEECPLNYQVDPTGTWKNMSIDLFSGSANAMVNVTHVASGIDATVGDGKFSWTCPAVTPNSAIYFYQFTQEGAPSPVWTSRFTIAAVNGSTTEPEKGAQEDGSPVPWGVGALLSNSTNDSNSTTSSSNTTTPTNGTSIAFLELGACTADVRCPESAPCCSEFGFCGAGRNCLSGCNPLSSFKPSACAPVPACKDQELAFEHESSPRILANGSTWNGDAAVYDWIVNSISPNSTELTEDDGLRLAISSSNNRTAVSSTRSMLYGNVSVSMSPSSEAGIVTSFSLVSGTQDEIIYEFTNNATSTAYYHRGAVGEFSAAETIDMDRFDEEIHDYGLVWTPEILVWTFDGEPVRNISRNSTLNSTSGHFKFPMNPSLVQLLIWSPGHEGGDQQIIQWAGGVLRIEDADAESLSSYVEKVKMTCFDPTLIHFASPNITANSTTELGNSTVSSGSASLGGQNGTLTSNSEISSSTAPALWWTPTVTAWWTPPAAQAETPAATAAPATRVRRMLHWLQKRAEQVSSYSYGPIGDDGQPTISFGDAVTTISDSSSSGLNMQPPLGPAASGTATASGASSHPSGSSASGSSTASSSSASSTETGKTLSDKWNALPDAARIGIYIGAGVVGLLLVVLVAFLWRLASRSRAAAAAAKGEYKPIDDHGEMIATGPLYRGTGDLYSGDVAPAEPAPKRAPSFPGGFVPSKSLRRSRNPETIPYTPPPEAMHQYMPRY